MNFFENLSGNTALLIFVLSIMISCGGMESSILPSATGELSEVLVVVSDKYWNNNETNELKKVLYKEQEKLPQPETYFTIARVKPIAFKNILLTHRNIVLVNVADTIKPNIRIVKNKWSDSQLLIDIKACSIASLDSLLLKNEHKIISTFRDIEKKRLNKKFKHLSNKDVVHQLEKEHALTLNIPNDYFIAKNEDNFIWLRKETSELSMGIIVYYKEYISETDLKYTTLIKTRDSLLKKHIPGPSEGSYMQTHLENPPIEELIQLPNQPTITLKGLWYVENDFMGGPFISHTFVDTINNRVITSEGYVYAPKFEKRNYLLQVETIASSISIITKK